MKKVKPAGFLPKIGFLIRENKIPAALVFLLALLLLMMMSPQGNAKETLVKVTVAKNDLVPGQEIKEEDLDSADFPKDFVPRNALIFSERQTLTGKTAVNLILKGDILTAHSASFPGAFPVSKIIGGEQKVFYLKKDDLPTIPPSVALKDRLNFYALNKGTGNIEKILENAEVIDVRQLKKDGEVSLVVLSLTEAEISKLIKALAEGWYVQIAILPKE